MKLRQLTIGVALCITSLAGIAKEWELVNNKIPGVYEESTNNKAIMIFPCEIKEGFTPVLFIDDTQEESLDGTILNFKARIDKGQIHSVKTEAIVIGGIVSMPARIDDVVIAEMMNGKTLRLLWPLENGRQLIEEYSLTGFTKQFQESLNICTKEEKNDVEEWFPDDEDFKA